MHKNTLLSLLVAAYLASILAGCGSAPVVPMAQPAPAAPAPTETSDQSRLRDALMGRGDMSPAEVADLGDRLLASGSEVNDQDLARLELAILKALKSQDKSHHAALWRNLGIIHYHQKKYKQARQELQASNELNPKNARTHFYLGRLFANLGEISEKQGKTKLARQQLKRAAIEMEMARKIDPGNPLYRQEVKPKTGRP